MEYIKMELSKIIPYENNPRINDSAVNDVKESIKQCTYISPIIVDENNIILAGHTRFKALTELNFKTCEVLKIKNLTEEQKTKFRLYDNKVAEFSEWDMEELLKEIYNLDFNNYDFGQPSGEIKSKSQNEKNQNNKKQITCPCCGEIFEC